MMGFSDSICAVESKGVTLKTPKMTMLAAFDKSHTSGKRGLVHLVLCDKLSQTQRHNNHSTWPCFPTSKIPLVENHLFTPLFSSGN